MMRHEFIQLTGIYPSSDLWDVIEEMYMNGDADKQTFCKNYKRNKNGMAQIAQERADEHAQNRMIHQMKKRKAWEDRENELLDDYYKKCEELNAAKKELEEMKAALKALKTIFEKVA